MPTFARKHHFVPEAVLAGFTKSGRKDDKLWTVDLVTKREWPATPKNVGHRRDFYRVDAEGISPDFVENRLLGSIDGCAVNIIREIERTSSLPSDHSAMQALLLFIALQITRVPLARFGANEILDRVQREQINRSLESPEKWAKVLVEMQSMGIDTTGMDYAEMPRVLSQIRFEGTQHFHLKMMFDSALDLVQLLMARNWGIRESTSGNFICCDRPVVLAFATPPPWTSFPGLALPNTDVFVPLTKHILLIGTWASRQVRVGQMTHKSIARVNSRALDNAQRFIFASSADFPWMDWRDPIKPVRHGSRELPRKSDKPVLLSK